MINSKNEESKTKYKPLEKRSVQNFTSKTSNNLFGISYLKLKREETAEIII